MLSATILVLLFIPTLSSPAAAPATAGGNTAQGDQIDGCLSPTKTDPPSFLPQVSDSEHQDAPYKKYIDSDRPSIYGGLTCCAKDGESDLSDNLVSSMSAACRGLYEYCGQCAEAWERVFFAAACSPQQASFVKQTENQTYYTLYMHKDLALSLWEGCKEDDELVSDHGTHGRPLKYVYNNALDYKGVTWNTHQLKAKFYVEDLVMKHTPALYLSEATQRLHIIVAEEGSVEEKTAMRQGNLKVDFYVKPYCAESGHPITEAAASIIIRLVLLFIGTWVANFLHLKHITWLPESGVFIVFGLIYGAVIIAVKGEKGALDLAFDATLLNLVLLPPIIFYSGFSMHHSNFGANLTEILILALFGTLLSTFGTGFGLYFCKDLGFGDFPTTLNIYESLAFAALISAVDPVATLATFDALQVDPNVEVLIFGESLLNDAVAIVLYKSFAQFAENGGITPEFGITEAVLKFVELTFGSIFVGFFATAGQSVVFKFTFFKHTPVLEILTFMFLSYSSFIVAEYFHWSGIIASLIHGVGCALFVKPNMSQEGHFRAELISHSLAALADMLIFIMVGYSGVQTITSVFDVSWALTGVTLLLCLVLRAVSTFAMVPMLNLCRTAERKIGMNEAFLMWWSGLRGAIAIGLVAAMPSSLRAQMMSATCLIVFFTVFVLGGGTAMVLKKMGIKMGINKPPATGKLGGTAEKLHNCLLRILTNQDENDDGIDDRYQSTSYSREMSRRGSIVASSLERSGTINVLQGVDLKKLQALADANEKSDTDTNEKKPGDADEQAKSTLNWE